MARERKGSTTNQLPPTLASPGDSVMEEIMEMIMMVQVPAAVDVNVATQTSSSNKM